MSFSEWREVKLEECAECIFSGGTPSTKIPEYWNGEFPWLSSGETRNAFIYETEKKITQEGIDNSSTKIAKKDDVVIASAGQGNTRGQTSICKIDTYINQSIISIRSNQKKMDPYYLFYNIYGRYNELRKISDGHSIRGSLTTKIIKDLYIKIPPLQEQKAIAHILSTLDDKIEVNNQINKTLENMAQAIFKQWFVDFEFPNEDGEPYKSSGGEMVESELGMIPKGWGVEEIGNISDIQNGFAFKAPEYVDEGVKVLRTLNIGNDGYFNNTDIVFLPQSYKSEKYEKYYFEEFDVALVMVGASIGKIGMILKNTAGGLQNQNMWRFRRKEKRVSQIFIYYTVKQAQNISKNWSTGSARDFYRKDSFRKIKVILPEKRIMDLFEKITKPIFQNISNHVCENDELISMRDGLLPKLMSGEIRVPLYEEDDAS